MLGAPTVLAQLPTTPRTSSGPVVGTGLTVRDWVASAVILAAAIALGIVLERIIRRFVRRGDADHGIVRIAGSLVRNITILVGLIYALETLDVRLTPLLGALGIGGLAIAFAAQSILENTFASLLLRTRRPFRRGDQISTAGFDGTVVEVNYRTVVLRTYDGERVLVPCSQVLGNPIVNHTATGMRRTTFPIGVAYDTDLEAAQRVVVEAVRAVEGVRHSPPPEALVSSFDESTITISLRYWHPPESASFWRIRSAVAIAVKRALDEAGVEIPFPQVDMRVVGSAADGQAERDTTSATARWRTGTKRSGAVTQTL